MYEPYPTSGPAQKPEQIQPPRSVLNAVKLMYAGAALEVLAVIIALVTIGSLKSAILARHRAYTTAQLHTAEAARTVPLVVGGLIAIGLWLWMAWANGKGRSWARIVSAVFFGINTLDLLISLLAVHAVATLIIGVVIWLVGLGAIVLLFSKESGPFYKQPPAPSDLTGSAIDGGSAHPIASLEDNLFNNFSHMAFTLQQKSSHRTRKTPQLPRSR